ncbi:hypothetical protein EVAR_18489_1 [Eumeta japonica]|uniref:Uncharacterized protein n=1 Tax=Eumeta variegata TaxID=151549 RepID=A0A4C1V0C8_EUMVA|nr:hypothetical protein EVAR_18489_1 [Eumeta japonica]
MVDRNRYQKLKSRYKASLCPVQIDTITSSEIKIANRVRNKNRESRQREVHTENGTKVGIEYWTKIKMEGVIEIGIRISTEISTERGTEIERD